MLTRPKDADVVDFYAGISGEACHTTIEDDACALAVIVQTLRDEWADCREENARLRAALEEAVVEYVPGSDPILDDWLPKARAALEVLGDE